MKYYRATLELARKRAPGAKSLIDIGNKGCEYVYEYDWIPEKTVLDMAGDISNLNGTVTKIQEDFYTWTPPKKYNLVTCLQVLEHVDDPPAFVEKLVSITDGYLLISVPYMWPAGQCESHLYDPMDLDFIHGMFPFPFDEEAVIEEKTGKKRFIGIKEISG